MSKIFKIAIISLLFNTAYGLYNFVIGVTSGSWWFISLSAYYIILSVMRFAILKVKKDDKALEIFIERFTGVMCVALVVVLGGTVYLSVLNERGIKHHQIVMINIAVYTFTKITMAIINLVKVRKEVSPIIKSLRNISFADAFVSVFSLQRSMLVTFEGMASQNIKLLNILTGSGVCVIVLLLGLNLIGGRIITNGGKIKNSKGNR